MACLTSLYDHSSQTLGWSSKKGFYSQGGKKSPSFNTSATDINIIIIKKEKM